MGDRPHQALTSVDESKIQVSQKPKLVRNDTFDPAKARDLRDATTPKREAAHGKHASLDSPSSEAKRSAKESQAADYAAMTKAAALLENKPAAAGPARVSRTPLEERNALGRAEVEQRGYGDAFWGHDRAAGAERYERDAMLAEETLSRRVGESVQLQLQFARYGRAAPRRAPRAESPRRLSLPHTQNPPPSPPFLPRRAAGSRSTSARCSATWPRARAARRTRGPTTSGTLTRACRPTPS